MTEMRAKGTGSYDAKTKCWRLRGQGIHVTLKQLELRYNVTFTQTEPNKLKKESSPYWRRFLQDAEDAAVVAAKDVEASQKSASLRSRISGMIDRLRQENAANPLVEHLTALLSAPLPAIPDFGLLGTVESCFQPPDDDLSRVTIATEVKITLARIAERAKNSAYYQARQALDMLSEVAGHLAPDMLRVDHWRAFFVKVTTNENWNARTQRNIVRNAKHFLMVLEQERGVSYAFIRSKSFAIKAGDGQKIKYTEAEVRTALEHATGLDRLQLLLGLNAGMYVGDMVLLRPDMIQGDYVVWRRAKLGTTAPRLRHRLWAETMKALSAYTFDATEHRLQQTFKRFRLLHLLPEHKALRKSVTQLIKDRVGDDESRYYRGEMKGGVHMENYIERRLGDVEQTQLDKATDAIATMFGM